MNKCEKCGTQVPEGAKFCPKCGGPIAVKTEQPTATTAAPQSTQGASGFAKIFWVLFATLGLLSYLLLDVGALFLNVSIGFGTTLAVFAMLCGFGFLAVCIVNKVTGSAENKKKYAVRNNVCLAIGIVVCTMVFLGSIVFYVLAGRYM